MEHRRVGWFTTIDHLKDHAQVFAVCPLADLPHFLGVESLVNGRGPSVPYEEKKKKRIG